MEHEIQLLASGLDELDPAVPVVCEAACSCGGWRRRREYLVGEYRLSPDDLLNRIDREAEEDIEHAREAGI